MGRFININEYNVCINCNYKNDVFEYHYYFLNISKKQMYHTRQI